MYLPINGQLNYACEENGIQIKGRFDHNMYSHVYFKSSATISYPNAVLVSFYMLVLPTAVTPTLEPG